MIVLNKVSKSFAGGEVFKNLNLTFKKGKITVILGQSGVGKTTLLNVLAGLEGYEGEISSLPSKIAYAFQNPSLISNLTVKENILLASDKALEGELDYCLTALEIDKLKDKKAKYLSFGESQRVNFIRALLSNAELILIDESFSSLDVKSKLNAEKLLREHLEKYGEKTVIIVTHDISLASALADDIMVLLRDRVESVVLKEDCANKEKQIKEKLLSFFSA